MSITPNFLILYGSYSSTSFQAPLTYFLFRLLLTISVSMESLFWYMPHNPNYACATAYQHHSFDLYKKNLIFWNIKYRHNSPYLFLNCCGGGGIRTPGTLTSTSVFKTDAFNRSATPPIVVLKWCAKINHFFYSK